MALPILLGAWLGGMPAAAQQPGEGDVPATRERQEALFQELLARPDDLDLMLEYARVSVALEDYEAAISTLERILIYAPTLTSVKIELGAAYFRLGSDAVANYYFDQALASGDLTAEERAQIGRFQHELAQRLETSRFYGQAMIGIAASTNANLGPASDVVQVIGIPVILPANVDSESDVGVRVIVDLTHDYDLGQPDGDVWRTNLFGYGLQYFSEDQGNINDLLFRTGPTISIGEKSFGFQVRPFAEAELVRTDDQVLFRGFGGGVEASLPFSPRWAALGGVQAQERQFFDGRDDLDGVYSRGFAGVAWQAQDNLVLRGFVTGELGFADRDFNDYYQPGLRGSASYLYDPGLDWVSRNWRADGYLEVARRIYDEPNPIVNPRSRRLETEFRAGVSNTFFLIDDYFVRADLDFVDRNSSISNFDLDNLTGTLSFGSTF